MANMSKYQTKLQKQLDNLVERELKENTITAIDKVKMVIKNKIQEQDSITEIIFGNGVKITDLIQEVADDNIIGLCKELKSVAKIIKDEGKYVKVVNNKLIEAKLGDNKVNIKFTEANTLELYTNGLTFAITEDKLESLIKEGHTQLVNSNQVETTTDEDLWVEKEMLVGEDMEELDQHINQGLYAHFDDFINTDTYFVIPSENLLRGTGKTSTLAYLAIEHDLPLVVGSCKHARVLKNRYPSLRVFSDIKCGYLGEEVVLLDEADLDVVKKQNRNSTLVGVAQNVH